MKQDRGWIRIEIVPLYILISQHKETLILDVIDIKYDIILGISWLEHYNLITN
jgi:hypothetical protein